jgi:uncharacterized membrane protein
MNSESFVALTVVAGSLIVPAAVAVAVRRTVVHRTVHGTAHRTTALLCYLLGLSIGIVVPPLRNYLSVQNAMISLMVVLAIPLLTVPIPIRVAARAVPGVAMAFLFAVGSVIIGSIVVFLMVRPAMAHAPQIAGLTAAAFIGGEPSLDRLHQAIRAGESVYETVRSGLRIVVPVYTVVMLIAGPRIFGKILESRGSWSKEDEWTAPAESERAASQLKMEALPGLGAATLIAGTALGLSLLFPPVYTPVVVMAAVVLIGFLLSAVPQMRRLESSTWIGEYAVLVFAFVSGSLTNLASLQATSLLVTASALGLVVVAVVFQTLLCNRAGIGARTMMTASIATIASPAFVLLIAAQGGSRRLIAPGVAIGLVTYAVGPPLAAIVVSLFSGV